MAEPDQIESTRRIQTNQPSSIVLSPSIESSIKSLKALFLTPPEILRAITDHFVNELLKGLSVKGGNIPMIPGWVTEYPTGKEKGDYLAIDLGGTNLRVCLVKLGGDRTFDTIQSKFGLPLDIRTTEASKLFSFIANCLSQFVEENKHILDLKDGHKLPLGFTFSYPCSQKAINHGVLQRWTKGYDIKGVEGHDVVPMLQDALNELELPIEVVALINDTTGTLVASAYTDPKTEMGLIFGTGCNGAYFERVDQIPKLADQNLKCEYMAINCEYGAFDNEHKVLPRTKYDIIIDSESPRPGQQAFEKMILGYYLGEVMRLVMVDLHEEGVIFKDAKDTKKLYEPYILDTSFPARIEEDPFENLSDVQEVVRELLGLETTREERELIRSLAESVGERSARLSVCGIAALAKKRNLKECHAAADGLVYNKYPQFKERAAKALDDIFGWNLPMDQHPIKIVAAEDGSGAGAAIIAALAQHNSK